MSLKTIHLLSDGIYVDDRSRPIIIVRSNGTVDMFKSTRDAALCLDLGADILVDAANKAPDIASATAVKLGTGVSVAVCWPSEKFIRAHPDFVDYKFVKPTNRGPTLAKPTVVTWQPWAGGPKWDEYHRSITSCRNVHGLTERELDAIVSQTPGWKDLLPNGVVKIEVKPHGFKIPAGARVSAGPSKNGDVIWEIRRQGKGKKLRFIAEVKSPYPRTYKDVRDIEPAIKNHAEYV